MTTPVLLALYAIGSLLFATLLVTVDSDVFPDGGRLSVTTILVASFFWPLSLLYAIYEGIT